MVALIEGENRLDVSLVAIPPTRPAYLNGALVGDILYYGVGQWSTTRNWYYNMRSLARFPIKNTGTVRAPVGIDFMGVREAVYLNPGQSTNWEITVQPLQGTNTYEYKIIVADPDTGIFWTAQTGSLTITGVYF